MPSVSFPIMYRRHNTKQVSQQHNTLLMINFSCNIQFFHQHLDLLHWIYSSKPQFILEETENLCIAIGFPIDPGSAIKLIFHMHSPGNLHVFQCSIIFKNNLQSNSTSIQESLLQAIGSIAYQQFSREWLNSPKWLLYLILPPMTCFSCTISRSCNSCRLVSCWWLF
jgi:hypothetical protein